MMVVRLGLPGDTSYMADELVEDYTSMIWTERFETAGDFQLKTPAVSQMLKLLPEKTLISVLESTEVMMVEDHVIDTDEDGVEILTITGRTVDFYLEHRKIGGPYGRKRKMAKQYTEADAVAVLLWQAFDNNSGKDVTREDDHAWNTLDAIPNVAISQSISGSSFERRWWLTEGPLETQLRDILLLGDLGIRTVRPKSILPADRISVDTALATRGNIVRTNVAQVVQLRFDIYNGVNRVDEVSFNYRQGDIEKSKYLFSVKEFKTAADVMSNAGGGEVYRNAGAGLYTGWERRLMTYDAGEAEEAKNKPVDPGKNATQAENDQYEIDLADWRVRQANIEEEFRQDAEKDALKELKKKRRTSLFTGDLSPTAPYVYGTHYGLGDTVSLHGAHNLTTTMFVAEYIRVEDEDGDRGYPGLTLP